MAVGSACCARGNVTCVVAALCVLALKRYVVRAGLLLGRCDVLRMFIGIEFRVQKAGVGGLKTRCIRAQRKGKLCYSLLSSYGKRRLFIMLLKNVPRHPLSAALEWWTYNNKVRVRTELRKTVWF